MGKFVLSSEALDDLDLIWIGIAQDNPLAADRVQDAAYRICRMLADCPELGRVRHFPNNAPSNIRSFVITDFPNYVIFYRIESGAVQIVRVLHGAQDIDTIFGGA